MVICSECRQATNGTSPCEGCERETAPLQLPALESWTLARRRGRGAFGVVYEVRQGEERRALKLIDLDDLARDGVDVEGARRTFENEVKALRPQPEERGRGFLSARYVVRAHGSGAVEAPGGQGLLWLLMDYVPRTLADRLKGAPLTMDEVVRLAVQLADGVVYLHAKGVVHRDLKPANIGLTHDDEVRILDFGLAGFRGSSWTRAQTLRAAMRRGTLGYAPPEQCIRGEGDERADLYALGAVLYEVVAGGSHLPSPAGLNDDAADLARWYQSPLAPLPVDPTRPTPLDFVIERCLAFEPGARLQPAAEAQRLLAMCARWQDAARAAAEAEATAEEARSEAHRAGRAADAAKRELDAAQRELRSATARVERAREAEAQAHRRHEALAADVAALEGRLATQRAETLDVTQSLTELAAQEERLRRSIAALERTHRALEASVADTQARQPPHDARSSTPKLEDAALWPEVAEQRVETLGAAQSVSEFATQEEPLRQWRSSARERAVRALHAHLARAQAQAEPAPSVAQPIRTPHQAAGRRTKRPPIARTPSRPALVFIDGGQFQMGSADSTYDRERPVHPVRVSSFWMAATTVTEGQWRAVMERKRGRLGLFSASIEQPTDRRPKVQVSWEKAVAFCNALSGVEDLTPAYDGAGDLVAGARGYRLPTEAEWEYACRAGTTTPWSCGDQASLEKVAWYNNNPSAPQPVGQKAPNPWGLFDMHGNVWEWCQDWFGPYTTDPAVDHTGPSDGRRRVQRGGAYWNDAVWCRSAFRHLDLPGNWFRGYGFRLVRPAPDSGS